MAIGAIALAAGASERMGTPKALLTLGGETFVARVIGTLRRAGLERLVLVTGVHHDATVAALAGLPIADGLRIVRNDAPDADQLSSLLCGLDVVDAPDLHAVLVALVDHPLVRAETINDLVHGFLDTRAPVVRPSCRGRHGHPVIFARETFELLRRRPAGGARSVVSAMAARSLSVESSDEGVWTDVDTPDAYREVLGRFGHARSGEPDA